MSQLKLTKELIKSRKIIRDKFSKLKKNRMEVNRVLSKNLQPLLNPLNTIAANFTPKTELVEKKEKKEEPDDDDEESKERSFLIRKRKITEPLHRNRKKLLEGEKEESESAGPSFLELETIADTSSHTPSPSIKQIYETPSGNQTIRYYLENFNELPRKYLQLIISDVIDSIDTVYGLRFDADKQTWMIGNSQVEVDGDDLIIQDQKFKGTEGLYNLIVLKQPLIDTYDKEDLMVYGRILRLTSAHKRGYREDAQINGNKSYKYTQIIKKLFPIADRQRGRAFSTPGYGLVLNKPKFVYWNSVNELVDRLRLLYGEKEAGNTSVDNEITAIVEELLEEGIIKHS